VCHTHTASSAPSEDEEQGGESGVYGSGGTGGETATRASLPGGIGSSSGLGRFGEVKGARSKT
jgi:hypothetical protein